MESDGFVPILALFYAVFHPTEGTKVLYQVPEGSIGTAGKKSDSDLFDFDTIKNYIIPKAKLCNRLISIKVGKYKVLGYPVNLENPKYSRNSFNFNFCFVFSYNSDTTPYESAIERMGKMFQVLEEQSFILSSSDKSGSFFKANGTDRPMENRKVNDMHVTPGFRNMSKITLSSIESLMQQIFQDLNNYSECCIPLDSANSVDIKLFPILPAPLNIKAYQVPVLTVELTSLVDLNWDPTMLKILPFINGVNSVKVISDLADADYILTKQCIQHLMHYKCIKIIDVFQFNAIYAPTNNIGDFLTVSGMAEECQAYIITEATEPLTNNSATTPSQDSESVSQQSPRFPNSLSPLSKATSLLESKRNSNMRTLKIPSKATLFYLYRSLNQGQRVKDWYLEHKKSLTNIDIRRFITFGVIRGIIYRVNSFPILSAITRSIESRTNDSNELVNYFKQNLWMRDGPDYRDSVSSSMRARVYESKDEISSSPLKSNFPQHHRISFGAEMSRRRYSNAAYASESDSEESSSSDENIVPTQHERSSSMKKQTWPDSEENLVKLLKLLNGFQNMDSICTEMQKSPGEIYNLISCLGSYDIVNS
ncbi:Piso0_004351 [Millerozyma farinosa CBS 7064]|uniref:Piso0_004351 protein n=1 Tax=Pichia sorbitophila (strain ATCC MYA-4447 / BCRC 22081 / CBS 7064 / NBRC 10061 / NRRL Y-12695) TaxID=559304 RepID=G8Y865_PICSO|nr:Piso0_004351 [Millerozyma farinosa CBS 7064]CCE84795.1 Piso0_004351 [Millerozyma farinosa CBS 7064]